MHHIKPANEGEPLLRHLLVMAFFLLPTNVILYMYALEKSKICFGMMPKYKTWKQKSNLIFKTFSILSLTVSQWWASPVRSQNTWSWFAFWHGFIFMALLDSTWERREMTCRLDSSPGLLRWGHSLCTWDTCSSNWGIWALQFSFIFFEGRGDDMQRRATGQTRTLSKSCVYVTHTLPTELTANLVKNVFGNQRQKAKYPLTNLSRWVLCWGTCQIVTLCDGSRPVLHSQSVSIWRVVSETHKTTYLTNSTCKEGTFVEI